MLSVVDASPGRVHCEISAEGTGRAPTTKRAPKCGDYAMGPAEELPRVRTRVRSLHFGHCDLMVGSLPSRALVQLSLRNNTLPPVIVFTDGLQSACILQVC